MGSRQIALGNRLEVEDIDRIGCLRNELLLFLGSGLICEGTREKGPRSPELSCCRKQWTGKNKAKQVSSTVADKRVVRRDQGDESSSTSR